MGAPARCRAMGKVRSWRKARARKCQTPSGGRGHCVCCNSTLDSPAVLYVRPVTFCRSEECVRLLLQVKPWLYVFKVHFCYCFRALCRLGATQAQSTSTARALFTWLRLGVYVMTASPPISRSIFQLMLQDTLVVKTLVESACDVNVTDIKVMPPAC